MTGDDLRSAVAAAALGGEELRRSLLGSIVEVARAILGARASSIMLVDESAGELVFEAVAGEGSAGLVGSRIRVGRGIAGWVAQSGETLAVDDVGADPRFARDVAEQSGYVPRGLIAVPLIVDERVIGVLSVLDRPERSAFSITETDLLSLFAHQAAAALAVVGRARRAQRILDGEEDRLQVVARLAAALDRHAGAERAPAAMALMDALERVLHQR